MKTSAAFALAGLFALSISCAVKPLTTEPPAHSQKPATSSSKSSVRLEISFEIPQESKQAISHTPAVVFTTDGKRMLTATSSSEIAVFELPSRRLLQRIPLPLEGTYAVSIDDSGWRVAWVLKKGGVAVLDLETRKMVAKAPDLKAHRVALAPGGKLIALSLEEEIELRETATLRLVRSLKGHEQTVTNLTWSLDGERLASTAKDGRMIVHEVATGGTVLEVKKDTPLYAVDFHPRGTAVAYGGEDNKVYHYSFGNQKEEVVSQNQPYWITCLGFSPDGEMIAVGDESCDIWLYVVGTKGLSFHNKHHQECWLSAIAWAPDNETFLFGCRPNSHAGKPTLHTPLVWAEAAQSQEVRESRRRLIAEVNGHLAQATNEGERKTLKTLKLSLMAEAQSNEYLAQSESSQGLNDFPGVDVALASQMTLTGATFALEEPQIAEPESAQNQEGAAQENTDYAIWLAAIAKRSPKGIAGLEEDTAELPSIEGIALADLPPAIRKLIESHAASVKKEIDRLRSSFQVNQWKVLHE